MQRLGLLFVLLSTFLLASCGGIKKKCNETNWFKHGQTIAKKGQRIDDDDFVKQCKRAEADIQYGDLDLGFKKGMENYCKPQYAFEKGKKGEKYPIDLCEGYGVKRLMAQHKKGVRQFCTPRKGFEMGAKGWKYNQICPADLEKKFVRRYTVGRKKFLRIKIRQNKEEISELDRKVVTLENQKDMVERQMQRLGPAKTTVRERVFNTGTGQWETKTKSQPNHQVQNERRRLSNEISAKRREIDKVRKKQDQLRAENRTNETEMAALDDPAALASAE